MTQNPTSLIRSYHPSLSDTEKKIADYILNKPMEVKNMNIAELSKITQVAESSISRFSKKIGYSGFKELKLALASHNHNRPKMNYFKDVLSEDENSFTYILQSFIQGNMKNFEENMLSLDYKMLENISKVFKDKKHIFVWGIGYSGQLGESFTNRVRSVTKNISVSKNEFNITQDSYLCGEDDVVLALSQSGNPIIVESTKIAKEQGTTIITLTSSYDNNLFKIADYKLVPASHYNDYKSAYIGNELFFKMVLDALYVYLEVESHKETTEKHRLFLDHYPIQNTNHGRLKGD